MRALIKDRAAAGLSFIELPEPTPGPGEAKVRVLRTGICGTDLHIDSWDHWAQGAITAPLVPGHEFSGEVVELGDGVESVRVGDLVSAEGHVVCGTCRNCRAGRRHMCIRTSSIGVDRDGAFAEFVVVPAGNLWVHPPTMDPDLAAIFDPLGNAVHTALTFPLVGEDVLITGAGPIGLMAARIAQHVGARHVVVTDVNPSAPRARRADGRRPRARRAHAPGRRRLGRTRALGGLRRRPRDQRPGVGARRDADQPEPRRKDRAARAAERRLRDRLGEGRHPHDHDPGHLRPADVRDLVPDDGDARVGTRRLAGHHRPFPGGPSGRRRSRTARDGVGGKVLIEWAEREKRS